jgi:hypothetical protein
MRGCRNFDGPPPCNAEAHGGVLQMHGLIAFYGFVVGALVAVSVVGMFTEV